MPVGPGALAWVHQQPGGVKLVQITIPLNLSLTQFLRFRRALSKEGHQTPKLTLTGTWKCHLNGPPVSSNDLQSLGLMHFQMREVQDSRVVEFSHGVFRERPEASGRILGKE
ncbi:hypothetical protein R1flu_002952 [Riccia fluitans]|uniref:Uncharacterized protein n=1 Tax=Riccia fluitans TaxID=41844 RepID=A0ABD1YAL1_9MARC